MIFEGLENIETFVLLDWFVRDFDYKFPRYQYIGDHLFIQHVIDAASRGRIILAKIRSHLADIAKKFELDLDYESIPTQVSPPDGPWVNVHYFSFGMEVEELANTYATRFIIEFLTQKMELKVPSLKFKLFFLPSLPVAITERGHEMSSFTGFANIRKGRVEINIYPPQDYKRIFKTMVHEILHICFLEESSVEQAALVESKTERYVTLFFTEAKEEYRSQGNRIHGSIQAVIEKSICHFKEVNIALKVFKEDWRHGNSIVETLKMLFDMILEGRIKAVPA